MSESVNYSINFTGNAVQVMQHIQKVLGDTQSNVKKTTGVFGDCWKSIMTANQALEGFRNIGQVLADVIVPGVKLNSSLKDLQAITGVNDTQLKSISASARDAAKAFGTDAAQNVESYKIILSKLGPEIAQNNTALTGMGTNVNILSKLMGGDTVASANLLTTAMNQYNVSLDDPIAAQAEMTKMMDTMAEAARVGSAELPQIGQALENVGMISKTAGLSFETTNAAIQVLDKAGAKGAEGGVALRNVLTAMISPSSAAADGLKKYGIDVEKLGDKNLTLQDRLKMLKPAMKDAGLMAQLFGKENLAAGLALGNNVESISKVEGALGKQGSAQEQAKKVMESYAERVKISDAKINDYKISLFNATEKFQPFIQGSTAMLTEVGKMGTGVTSLGSIFSNNFTKGISDSVKANGGFYKTIVKGRDAINNFALSVGKGTLALVKKAAQFAITGAMAIGSFVVGIASATVAQMGLNVAMSANPIGLIVIGIAAAIAAIALLITYWDEIKAAIAKFAKWIWEHHPFKFLIDMVDKVFPGFKDAMGKLWDWISEKFTKLINWFKDAWKSIKSAFGFGGDDKELPENKKEADDLLNEVKTTITKEEDNKTLNGFGSAAAESAAAKEKKAKDKKNNVSAASSNNGTTTNKTIHSLVINSLVKELHIHTTNLGETKEQIKKHITEVFVQTVSDFNLSNA